jgi:hypothetical protein
MGRQQAFDKKARFEKPFFLPAFIFTLLNQ